VRAAELLRRLDDSLLPPLAQAMAKVGHGPARLRMLTGVALVSATAVLLTAVWATQRVPGNDMTVGDVVRVGVSEGDSIPSYVKRSRTELDALDAGSPYALVTFRAYFAPDRLRTVLAGAAVSEVFARVPLRDRQTQIVRMPVQRVPEDVDAGMLLFAERKDREARDYQERAAAADDPAQQRSWLDSAEVASAEATAYRTHCSCVYAAVVQAAPAELKTMAARSGVRAVDPAPEVRRLDGAVFLPPLPEQDDLAGPPTEPSPEPSPADGTVTTDATTADPVPPASAGRADPSPGQASASPPQPSDATPDPGVTTPAAG
jgi:hypothetical protein